MIFEKIRIFEGIIFSPSVLFDLTQLTKDLEPNLLPVLPSFDIIHKKFDNL